MKRPRFRREKADQKPKAKRRQRKDITKRLAKEDRAAAAPFAFDGNDPQAGQNLTDTLAAYQREENNVHDRNERCEKPER